MTLPRLSNLEMRIMEALWTSGELSIREIQESFPATKRPAYSTVQTMVQRLEAKKACDASRKLPQPLSLKRPFPAMPPDAA